LESSRPKPGRMEETLKGGRGPSWAVAPLERERERVHLVGSIIRKNETLFQSLNYFCAFKTCWPSFKDNFCAYCACWGYFTFLFQFI